MGFLDTLKSLLPKEKRVEHWIHVRCRRCREVVKTRVDLQQALNPSDEGGYLMRKTLVGNQLCFQRIELTLKFDNSRQLVDHEIEQGEFVMLEEKRVDESATTA